MAAAGGRPSGAAAAAAAAAAATTPAAAAAAAAAAPVAAPVAASGSGWPAGLKPPSVMHVDHGAPAGAPSRTMQSGRAVVRSLYSDGTERVEEWDGETGALVTRRWRGRTTVGGEGGWEYEFGEPPGRGASSGGGGVGGIGAGISEAAGAPVVSRRNAPGAWEFRIRNLFWPVETYELSVAAATQQIVLRTTNKKYYKTLDVPHLWRARIPLDRARLSMEHAVSSLVIRYAKPAAVVVAEAKEAEEVGALLRSGARDGDIGCKPQ